MRPLIRFMLLFTIHAVVDSEDVSVTTVNGDLVGLVADTILGRVVQFLGVPYAKPPIGKLRWKPPEPPDNWRGPRDARSFSPCCPHSYKTQIEHFYTEEFVRARIRDQTMSEDCLYLNMYVPRAVVPDRERLLPVFVYIHGGKYEWGSGVEFNGTFLALQGNMIVITFNYRLNIFGFLSNGEPDLAGNYGVFDTVQLLEWIQTNIRAFGGDPALVTVGGESAGGVIVDLLLTACPQVRTRGLVRRGIALGGVYHLRRHRALIEQRTINNSRAIAALLNCTSAHGEIIVRCLRKKSTDELLSAFLHYQRDPVFAPNLLLPIPDGNVIDRSLEYPGPGAHGKDYMISVCNFDSGAWFGIGGTGPEINTTAAISFTKGLIQMLYPGANDFMTDAVIFEYTSPNLRKAHQSWLELWQDAFFLAPGWEHALLWPKNANVYFLNFAHKPSFSKWPSVINGANHMEELYFMFGDVLDAALFPSRPTDEEVDLSIQFMTAVGNFAWTGNPNPISTSAPLVPTWPRFDSTDKLYLEWTVGLTSSNVKRDLKARRMEFWNTLLPKFLTNKGWRAWSDWKPCRQPSIGTGSRYYSCRRRLCDNPLPDSAGQECTGEEIECVQCSYVDLVCNIFESLGVCNCGIYSDHEYRTMHAVP
ncbi:carboxylesterase 5A-like [Lingula anatina]|uniref:Carboxylic ester hydrolase n=1 Tax=Lingula anatina TaxID=7574 RepID=A0A1S3IQ84_LINAN|nr:carboxylesterase 5A-like [Lingula anatina]|eukprot:XP_013399699.1 carboxylesterase 5A-like [Lingula anatina]